MPKSHTSNVIQVISRDCLGPALKPYGFFRKSPHFYRPSGDVYHCVHFQASQWGSASSGKFTINLAVTSPSLYTHWTSRPLPANPATALWPIEHRLGLLSTQRRDIWWDANADTDAHDVGREIAALLREFGLPFFDGFRDSDAILLAIRSGGALPGVTKPQLPLIEAMLLKDRGRTAEAKDCICRALAQTSIVGFRQTIMTIAGRLGLQLTKSGTDI